MNAIRCDFFEHLSLNTPFRVNKVNRYRQICIKVDASIFDSALSHTRRSDASEKIEENTRVCGQVSSPRLYRLINSKMTSNSGFSTF